METYSFLNGSAHTDICKATECQNAFHFHLTERSPYAFLGTAKLIRGFRGSTAELLPDHVSQARRFLFLVLSKVCRGRGVVQQDKAGQLQECAAPNMQKVLIDMSKRLLREQALVPPLCIGAMGSLYRGVLWGFLSGILGV